MLSNIEPFSNLGSLFRFRGRTYVTKTVGLSSVDEMLTQGWSVAQKNEKSYRLKKEKEGNVAIRDRVWSLLHRMEFLFLNGEGKAILTADVRDLKSQTIGIDVVGIDNEVGLAIWCRSFEEKCTKETFRQELEEFILSRQRFAQSINQDIPTPFDRQYKRVPALAVFTSGIFLSEEYKQRAKEGKIILFSENELSYYETLVSHLGPAAKYQFLADMLPNKEIPGLYMRVPAIKTKMGRFTCYSFSIPPEYLLKISYVSHRSKGRGSDITTYQRMIQKSRLEKIRRYIDDRNIFPTNIVIHCDIEPEFHQRQQCIKVLRSVFHHLATHGVKLLDLSKEELFEQVKPFVLATGNYLVSFTEEERKQYRDLRGVQGQFTRTKRIEQAIHESIPEFFPPGLKDFIEQEKARTNDRAKAIVDKIERILQKTIIEELKRKFGPEETEWWMQGIPSKIRMKTNDKYEEDLGKRGSKEFYFAHRLQGDHI